MKPEKMIPLDQFPDNDVVVYKVDRERKYWEAKTGDPTRSGPDWELVTKRMLREGFIQFLHETPELDGRPRDEQIRQFNLHRRELKLPKIDPEILADVLVPTVDELGE